MRARKKRNLKSQTTPIICISRIYNLRKNLKQNKNVIFAAVHSESSETVRTVGYVLPAYVIIVVPKKWMIRGLAIYVLWSFPIEMMIKKD